MLGVLSIKYATRDMQAFVLAQGGIVSPAGF
jgi:hypothetical protein